MNVQDISELIKLYLSLYSSCVINNSHWKRDDKLKIKCTECFKNCPCYGSLNLNKSNKLSWD